MACKREPCNRCTPCPQGTNSKGGARGVYGTPNATVATCVAARGQTFQLTITTNPKGAGGAWECDAAFAPVLKGLIEGSIVAQGAVSATATPASACAVDANTAAAYTFDVTYQVRAQARERALRMQRPAAARRQLERAAQVGCVNDAPARFALVHRPKWLPQAR